jgi:hypothetical protein
MMRAVLSALVLLAGLGVCLPGSVSAARWADPITAVLHKWNAPKFCRGYDCPKFKVLKTDGNHELRKYKPATWIATNVTDMKFDDATAEGIKRLMKYTSGENENETKIETTTPYFTLLYPSGQGRAVDTRFTVQYFLPFKLQDYPPEPKAEELGFVEMDEHEVWVRTFGGFAKEKDVLDHAFDFMDTLRDQDIQIEDSVFGFAQYDSIARLLDRHNEVWIWAKKKKPTKLQCPKCSCPKCSK